MNTHLLRAQFLINQDRHEQARPELQQALADSPDDPYAHALLALCQAKLGRNGEATELAKRAVHLGPDVGYCHFVLAIALQQSNKLKEAEASAREAIRLEPDEAEHFSALAAIQTRRERWKDALEAADEGLKRDPGHELCLNLRTLALTQLGRREEAASTVEGALRNNPDNALSHANAGWTALHKGEHKAALKHFREALRLDPQLDMARGGLVEALKARYFLYRLMLTYFLWMSRLSNRTRWLVILGGYLAYRAAVSAARTNPALQPVLTPFIVLYVVFVFMTWMANPLFEALLRLNRFGRYALTPPQTASANALVALVGGGLLLIGAGFWLDLGVLLLLAVVLLGLTIPACTALRHGDAPGGTALRVMVIAIGFVGIVWVVGFVARLPAAASAFVLFVLAVVFFPWVANFVRLRSPG